MLHKLFDSICKEKDNKTYEMILFSQTRWSSIILMFKSLLKCRAALTYIPYALNNEREWREIDSSFDISSKVQEFLNSSQFWSSIEDIVEVLEPVCVIIANLEAATSALSDVYACFVYLRGIFKDMDLETTLRNYLDQCLLY